MIGRIVLALAAMAAAAGVVRAEPAKTETVAVVRDCPSTGWHRACLPIAFFFRDDGSGRLHFRTDRSGYYPRKVLDHIVVRGSLIEGRGPGVFRLKLDTPVGESEADSPEELGGFAFVGRSRTGRPVVLTDQGPLEILTPAVDFESTGDLFVVREANAQVVGTLISGYAMPFVAAKTGEVGVWDAARGICIAAPSPRTRELQIITSACKAAGVPEDGVTIGGNASVHLTLSEERAREILGSDPVSLESYAVPGTGVVLIWVNWQDCC